MLSERTHAIVTVLLTALIVVFVAAQLLGQPMLFGFVASDSMAPTLEAGDGFVAVPHQLSGDPEVGDVVIFEAQELDGGGLTTHRIVDETDAGYVTKGDANAVTDQDGEEPPVTDERIVGTALQLGGWVVPIPGLGTAILAVGGVFAVVQASLTGSFSSSLLTGVRGVGVALVLGGAILFAASSRRDRSSRRTRTRSGDGSPGVDGRRVALVLALLVLVPVNAAMIAPSGPTHVTADGDRLEGQVEPGAQLHSEFTGTNDGLVTMLVALETADEDASIDRNAIALAPGESTDATLSVPAPPPGERDVVTVTEHRYVQVLPESVLLTLHGVHPVLAWGAINLLLTAGILTLVSGTIGLRSTRVRPARRSTPRKT